ncbi:MAG: efflux RND transporter permease subunit [Balneolaceae bacterium]
MRNVIRFFTKHVVLVNLSIVVILIFGALAALNLSSTFFPEQQTRFINIQAVYPGASPVEMEESIVLKIEDNVAGINGVKEITSRTEEDRTTVTVEIYTGMDPNLALQEIKNEVDRISTFPTGLEELTVSKEDQLNPAGQMVLRGDVSVIALQELADQIEDDLRKYDNITRISIFGYNDPEVEISVREADLRNYGLSISDVADAVSAENLRSTGGILRGEELEYRIRVEQREDFATGFKDIPVVTRDDGTIVRLSDVARVEDDIEEGAQRVFVDRERGINITVNTTNNEDILEASASIKEYIEEFNRGRSDVELVLVDDATQNLRERISLLQENGMLGAALVLLLLGMFLRIRLAFWVALSIPISLCGMFILATWYGLTINVISLFGMIIVIGILVDDGIVVGENIFQKYEEGLSPIRAAVEGTMEVVPAVTSAIITTVIAFSFFFFIPGQLGEFFSDVAFVVSATLIVSLIEVFIFLPAHLAHSKSLQKNNSNGKIQKKVANSITRFRDKFYIPFYEFSLRNKALVFFATLSVFILTIASIAGPVIRTTFFPEIEENSINVEVLLTRAINVEYTERQGRRLVEAGERLNERYRDEFGLDEDIIRNIEMRVGYETNELNMTYYLMSSEERPLRTSEIVADLREEVGPIPRAELVSYDGGGPFGKPVAISLFSSSFDELNLAADRLMENMRNNGELADVIDNRDDEEPEIHIELKDRAFALGITTQQVSSQIRDGFFGNEVQRLQRGKNEVRVWVRYNEDERRSEADILNMEITDPEGDRHSLSELADLRYEQGLVAIYHRDGVREVLVEADVANPDVSAPDLLNELESEVIPEIVSNFPSISYTLQGEAQETGEVVDAMQNVLPVVMILIFAIIVFTFKSISQALVIMLIIPFGIIGAAWGHYIHGIPLGILSLLGIIALVGILVNDGLVLVTAYNGYLEKGMTVYDAMVEAGRSRFRPIVLTTGTTAAGLAPLILDQSFQAQFLIPMAVSVAYGLIAATFLLLILLPIMLITSSNILRGIHWIWEGEWLPIESVQPVLKDLKWEEENEE